MRILITDGNNRASLAITRRLASLGNIIFIGDKKLPSLSSVSRYCTSNFLYSDPETLPDEFINQVIQFISDNNIDVLLPVSDITSFIFAHHKTELSKLCILPIPDYDILAKTADKAYISSLASSLDVPVPATITIKNADEFNKYKNKIIYPIVIKPARSRIKVDDKWIYTTVSYAKSLEELTNKIMTKHYAEFPILLQERIEGPGTGVFVCCKDGEILASFSHNRIREKPPSGGVSVLRESAPVREDLLTYSKSLLNKLKWSGVAMVEFKIDSKTDTPMLMEINGRFWGSLQLSIDSGLDFPSILLDVYTNKNIKVQNQYAFGVRSRWLMGDLDSLLLLFTKPKSSLNLANNHPGKFKTLLSFLKFWSKNTYYEVLRLNDIRPWLLEVKNWFK